MRRTVSLALLLLVPLLAGCTAPSAEHDEAAGHQAPSGIRHAPAGTTAPSFSVTTIDGEEVTLKSLEGKVVLLEFMGLGCSGCQRNLPDHQETWATFGADEGFVFLAVNVWHAWCGDDGCGGVGESEDDMRAYRDEHGLGWSMALASRTMADDYAVRGTPTHIFIDHHGDIHATGSILSATSLAAELQYLLDRTEAEDPAA